MTKTIVAMSHRKLNMLAPYLPAMTLALFLFTKRRITEPPTTPSWVEGPSNRLACASPRPAVSLTIRYGMLLFRLHPPFSQHSELSCWAARTSATTTITHPEYSPPRHIHTSSYSFLTIAQHNYFSVCPPFADATNHWGRCRSGIPVPKHAYCRWSPVVHEGAACRGGRGLHCCAPTGNMVVP